MHYGNSLWIWVSPGPLHYGNGLWIWVSPGLSQAIIHSHYSYFWKVTNYLSFSPRKQGATLTHWYIFGPKWLNDIIRGNNSHVGFSFALYILGNISRKTNSKVICFCSSLQSRGQFLPFSDQNNSFLSLRDAHGALAFTTLGTQC